LEQLGVVENECTSRKPIPCAIGARNYQSWWKFDEVMAKIILQFF